jgi:hypothetical protein
MKSISGIVPIERADECAVAGEGQAVASHRPQNRPKRYGQQRLSHGGQDVLLADHPTIEQRQTRYAHHQHEAGRGNHPRCVGGVDRWLRSLSKRRHRTAQEGCRRHATRSA